MRKLLQRLCLTALLAVGMISSGGSAFAQGKVTITGVVTDDLGPVPGVGVMVGVAYGLLQMIIDPYIISIPQLLVDYPFAFGALEYGPSLYCFRLI